MAPNLGQKLHITSNLNARMVQQAYEQLQAQGQELPVHVVKNDNSILTLAFDVDPTQWPLQNIDIPSFGPEYIRYPYQVGDKGVLRKNSVVVSNITGTGPTTPSGFQLPGNLSQMYFQPIASAKWSKSEDPNAIIKYGPTGGIVRDTNKKAQLKVHPTDGSSLQINDNQNPPQQHILNLIPSNTTTNQTPGSILSVFNNLHSHTQQLNQVLHTMFSSLHTLKFTNTNVLHTFFNSLHTSNWDQVLGAVFKVFNGKSYLNLLNNSAQLHNDSNVTISTLTNGFSIGSGGGGGGGGGGASVVGGFTATNTVGGNTLQMLQQFTVGQLLTAYPAASNFGLEAMVIDSTTVTFHDIVTGLGGNIVKVVSDGTNYRVGG